MHIFKKSLTSRVVVTLAAAFLALAQGRAALAATLEADITDGRYGAKADDGKDDTVAIQKAVDDLNEGGTLIIPPGTFTVSMAKGLRISKKHVHLILRGTIKAKTNGLEAPACKNLFDVFAEGCQFIGQGGMLCGDGSTFHGAYNKALHRVGLYPALIYVRGSGEWMLDFGASFAKSSGLPRGLHRDRRLQNN